MALNVLECIDRYVSIYVCSMIRCLRLAALISDVQMGQLIGFLRVCEKLRSICDKRSSHVPRIPTS